MPKVTTKKTVRKSSIRRATQRVTLFAVVVRPDAGRNECDLGYGPGEIVEAFGDRDIALDRVSELNHEIYAETGIEYELYQTRRVYATN